MNLVFVASRLFANACENYYPHICNIISIHFNCTFYTSLRNFSPLFPSFESNVIYLFHVKCRKCNSAGLKSAPFDVISRVFYRVKFPSVKEKASERNGRRVEETTRPLT